MTAKFEKQTTTEGLLTFELPVEDVKKSLDKAFNRIRKNLSVPGFRKGHVPRQIFNNVYGEEALYEDVLNELVPSMLSQALEEQDLEPVAQPEVNVESMEKGQPWVITAKVTTKPEVKLGEYKNLEVEEQDTQVSEEDLEQELDNLRNNFAELTLSEDPAKEGDTVVIDFEGFVDGEAFEGGQASNHSLELGSNSFIDNFEEQLVDTKAGDEVEVEVTFPEDYPEESLAGKEALFKVKVHEVKTKSLPELDDEFAKDADEEVENLAELKEKIEKQLQEQKEEAAQSAIEDAALTQAIDNAEIVDLPEVMVEQETQRQMEFFLNNLRNQGIEPEMYFQLTGSSMDDLQDQFKDEAETRTRMNLVLEAIIEAEDIEATEEEIDAEIMFLSKEYGIDPEQVRQTVTNDMLASDVALKKAMELVTDSVKLV